MIKEILENINEASWEKRAIKNTQEYFDSENLNVTVKLDGKFITIKTPSMYGQSGDIQGAVDLLAQDDVNIGKAKIECGDSECWIAIKISDDQTYWQNISDM